jgi:ATP-dependent DNA helicase RecQ
MPNAQHKVSPKDYEKAKRLRRDMSLAEKILWLKLRQLPKELGLSFRRQQPIHPYIVDFICLKLKLAIELDGNSHDTRQEQDAARDSYLQSLGYAVLRFSNTDLLANPDNIVATILYEIRGKHSR